MQRCGRWVMITLVMALAVRAAPAQRIGGGSEPARLGGIPPFGLLRQTSVQQELRLTGEQAEQVKKESRKWWDALEDLKDLDPEERAKRTPQLLRDADKAVTALLKPEQTKRLHQISLQIQGVQAFSNPRVVKEMDFSPAQKEKIQAIQGEMRSELREQQQSGKVKGQEAIMKLRADLNKRLREKIVALLTPEQKARWRELAGEPFTGEVQLVPPRQERKPSKP